MRPRVPPVLGWPGFPEPALPGGSVARVPSSSPTRSAPGRLLKSTVAYAEAAVSEVVARVPYERQELLRAATLLAHWAAHNDRPLDHGSVFADDTIDGFIRVGLPDYSDGSRGNVRSQLRRMKEALRGESAIPPERLAGAEAQAPYSKKDLARLTEWAAKQKTAEFRRDARTILALGLGAGLTAGEIGEVHGADILVDGDGVQVVVNAARSRTVQVLRSQEDRVLKAARAVQPADYLIRPARTSNPKNLISNIVDRGAASELGPQSQRMRATWLVRHLNSGVPAGVLMEAAGLESLKGLTRYLAFVEQVPRSHARSQLRDSKPSAGRS